MRQASLLSRLLVLVVSAVLAGSAVMALGSRSELRQARNEVGTAWMILRPPLDRRYQALTKARDAVRNRLGRSSPVLAEVDAALSRWRSGRDPDEGVAAANRLEGLAARLAATVATSPRLRSAGEVTGALDNFERAQPGPPGAAYNRAVVDYENVRGGFPRRLVAGVLGFAPARTLEPVG